MTFANLAALVDNYSVGLRTANADLGSEEKQVLTVSLGFLSRNDCVVFI